jgi:hypothetical protein
VLDGDRPVLDVPGVDPPSTGGEVAVAVVHVGGAASVEQRPRGGVTLMPPARASNPRSWSASASAINEELEAIHDLKPRYTLLQKSSHKNLFSYFNSWLRRIL